MAAGPAKIPTINTMAEITGVAYRIFSKSDIEEITLIMRGHPLFEKTTVGI
jgi:hypothetical protein